MFSKLIACTMRHIIETIAHIHQSIGVRSGTRFDQAVGKCFSAGNDIAMFACPTPKATSVLVPMLNDVDAV